MIFEEDYWAIRAVLTELLDGASAGSVLLVDHSGQIITSHGTRDDFDAISFASLCAADFEANRQLARLIGEEDFKTLYHQGAHESMYLSRVDANIIIAILFDRRTTLGLVRLRAKRAVDKLGEQFVALYAKLSEQRADLPNDIDSDYTARAEAEIDNLFRD
jgi:predicted regulator of Ras-like GTPase activity (Roadblock/LC7/MglB family)